MLIIKMSRDSQQIKATINTQLSLVTALQNQQPNIETNINSLLLEIEELGKERNGLESRLKIVKSKLQMKFAAIVDLEQARENNHQEINHTQSKQQALIKSLEDTFENLNLAPHQSLIDLSFKFNTVRTLQLKSDLTSRQFAMKIFEYLTEKPIKY
jgi:chromosome segregation ATPase